MASLEERVSRLESAQGDLVTKSDLAKAKGQLIKWIFGVGVGVAVLNSAGGIIVLRLMS